MLEQRLRAAIEQSSPEALLFGDGLDAVPLDGGVPAAVLIAITDRAEPGLILTKRPQTMRRHPGQVAFPGGRVDASDVDHVAAALREAEEEIALPRSAVTVIGPLAPYRTGTGYQITPVIGIIAPDLPLHPNDAEVEAIFEVPLAFLLNRDNHQLQTMHWEGTARTYHEMHWDGFRIWGATAAMIVNLGRQLSW